MKRGIVAALALAGVLMAPTLAEARFSFSVGDNVYADGQWFTAEEYQQYKATHPESTAAKPAAQPPAAAVAPATAPAATAPTPQSVAALPATAAPQAGPAMATALRAASCKTTKYYEEFPGEAEKFDCGGVGQLTRQEMLAQGWKIDFIEKLPAVAGQPTPSAYKLILSR
jgi:hypothetical protein